MMDPVGTTLTPRLEREIWLSFINAFQFNTSLSKF